MRSLLAGCLIVLVVAGSVGADITKYTSFSSWDAAVTAPVNTIHWDDVGPLADGAYQTIAGSRYSGMPGSPMLSVDASSGLYVGNPNNPLGGSDPSGAFYGADFFPVSGSNVFSPDVAGSPTGTMTISFGAPVYALGAWFLDVEGGFATTGIRIDGTTYAFLASQGDNSQRFLGIVSTTPFTTAQILMSAGVSDGVGIDDVKYALVPTPAAVLIGMLGLGVAGLKLRKFV